MLSAVGVPAAGAGSGKPQSSSQERPTFTVSNPEEIKSMSQYNMKASVDITVEAETPGEARKAAFDLITSARMVAKRGRNAGAAPKASVTGVTIDESGRHEARQCCRTESDVTLVADAMESRASV